MFIVYLFNSLNKTYYLPVATFISVRGGEETVEFPYYTLRCFQYCHLLHSD